MRLLSRRGYLSIELHEEKSKCPYPKKLHLFGKGSIFEVDYGDVGTASAIDVSSNGRSQSINMVNCSTFGTIQNANAWDEPSQRPVPRRCGVSS
jgi:hypothetical protein